MKLLTFIFALIFGISSYALEVNNCPDSFKVGLTKISAYKTSINSSAEGWQEKRDLLANNNQDREIEFVLSQRNKTTCAYEATTGESANLFSIQRYDEEDGVEYYTDQLLVKFTVQKTQFTLFTELKSLSRLAGLELYDYSDRTQVQTTFKHKEGKGVYRLDMGLAKLTIL